MFNNRSKKKDKLGLNIRSLAYFKQKLSRNYLWDFKIKDKHKLK